MDGFVNPPETSGCVVLIADYYLHFTVNQKKLIDSSLFVDFYVNIMFRVLCVCVCALVILVCLLFRGLHWFIHSFMQFVWVLWRARVFSLFLCLFQCTPFQSALFHRISLLPSSSSPYFIALSLSFKSFPIDKTSRFS